MQILYVSAMVGIFVLCLALLSTARRILQSTPLTSGQLSISKVYDVDHPKPESPVKMDSALISAPVIQAPYADVSPAVTEPIISKTASIAPAPPMLPVQRIEARPLFDSPVSPVTQSPAPAIKKTATLLPAKKAARLRKPSRRVYNYAFECLLLGVSAVVLIKTQRGVLRYRSSHPRVA